MEKVDWIVGLSGEKLGQKRGKMDQEIKAGKNLLSSFVTLDSDSSCHIRFYCQIT